MKSIFKIAIVSIILVCLLSVGYCDEITPYADEIFDEYFTSLNASGMADFYAACYRYCSSISVTSVVLQKKNLFGIWSYNKTLVPPSAVFTNSYYYAAAKSYSSDIGTGTYRLQVTYTAEGHSLTTYSNEVTR